MTSQNAINNTVANNDFSVNRQLAATQVVSSSIHSDNTSTTSHAELLARSGGASGGDPHVRFDVNGQQDFSLGIDNSDSDSLKITDDANPSSGTTLWKMTPGGIRIMPLQPAFRAGLQSATTNDVTGDTTNYTIIFNAETYDVNADYDNSTGLFTAPVAGVYLFSATALFANLGAGHTLGSLSFFINSTGPGFAGNYYNVAVMRDGSNNCSVSQTTMFTLGATDTVEVVVSVSNSTRTVGVFGSAGLQYTWFTGALLF